jgi:hypothetical protein
VESHLTRRQQARIDFLRPLRYLRRTRPDDGQPDSDDAG